MPPNKSSPVSSSHMGRGAAIQAAISHLNRRKKNVRGAPEVMTWGRALPIVIVAFLFDLVRIFFEWFWFFGPALIAITCTSGFNSILGTNTAGVVGKVVQGVCYGVATAAGFLGSETTIAFGVMMAEAVALTGWLTIGLWVFATNRRIFKTNGEDVMHMILLYLSILISFIPIIGTAPTVGWITYRFFKFQIKIEEEALKKYQEEQGMARLEEQQAQFMQDQDMQREESLQEEDVNEEENGEDSDEADNDVPSSRDLPRYGSLRPQKTTPRLAIVPNYTGVVRPPSGQAANDEIPDKMRKAA